MSSEKTRLQRQILLASQRYPRATNEEIAERVGCSASYVGQTLREYDDYDEFEATTDDVEETMDLIADDVDAMFEGFR